MQASCTKTSKKLKNGEQCEGGEQVFSVKSVIILYIRVHKRPQCRLKLNTTRVLK